MKNKQNKQKPLFKVRKKMSDKEKLAWLLGLFIVLMFIGVVPFFVSIPPLKMLVWALVLGALLDGIIFVLVYGLYADKENQKTKEHEKWQKAYKSLKVEKEYLQNRVDSFDRDIERERNERDYAIHERDEISKENNKLQSYKQTLKEMYLCSQMPDVRAYAEECLKREDCLDLFQPMRYIRDQNYARVIEANAETLLELIRKPSKWGISNASDVRKKLNELLKKGSTGVAGVGGSQVPTRERQTLKKIDNDMER